MSITLQKLSTLSFWSYIPVVFEYAQLSQSVSLSVSQSGSQSVNHSVRPSFCHSVSPSVHQSVSQSAHPCVHSSLGQSASQSVSPSVSQSASQSVSQSVSQSIYLSSNLIGYLSGQDGAILPARDYRLYPAGKISPKDSRVCWTKITIIYNFRNVYQMKDIQLWSESLKSVQVWVIEKSNNCALAHCSWKSTAGNFDRHVTDVVAVKIIFDKNSYHHSLKLVVWLPWHQFELDVWSWLLASFRVRDTKYLSVGFIFRISEVKIGADFGSVQNIQRLHGFFGSTELLALAGVDSLVLFGWKIDRGKTRLSLVVVRDCCSLPVRMNSTRSNSFFICSLEVGFLPFLGSSTLTMFSVFLRSFANDRMLYLPQ